jgi:hypothetical protein
MDVIRNEDALPQDNLQTALTAHAGLDTLYTRVLLHARRNDNFERVIGTVMLLREPLTITALAELLWLRAADIVHALLGIQSILMIPGDDDQPIRLFHTSLRDFLTSQLRSNNFYIDPIRHLSITADCLSIIAVPPKEGIFYNGGQKYACFNWCYHLHEALISEMDRVIGLVAEGSLIKQLTDFTFQLNFWVNTMLLDACSNTLNVLNLVLCLLEVSDSHEWLWNFKIDTLPCSHYKIANGI